MRLLIRHPLRALHHALELRGLRLVGRDAAEERAGERHVRAPPPVGEDGATAVHRGGLVGLPLLLLVLEFDGLALGLDVYLPVGQLDGETGVLAFATYREAELVIGDDDLGLPLVLVQVDLPHARGAQRLRDKARGLGVPLDNVNLLVAEFRDHSPHAAAARADARPDGVYPGLVRPHGHLRAQPRLTGDGLYLDEAVVDLRNLQLEEPPEEALVATAHRQARAAPGLPDLQQVNLEPLPVLVALVGDLFARRQERLDPPKVHERHPPVSLLDDAGHDVADALAVLLDELLAVHLVEALVEGLAHDLGRYAGEVIGGYVLVVLHNPEVTGLSVKDHPGALHGPLAVLIGREQGLLEHPRDRLER